MNSSPIHKCVAEAIGNFWLSFAGSWMWSCFSIP